MAAASAHQTTLLIPNLHCPSCVANIESALYALKPQPLSISHSILSHTITILHPLDLSVARICVALEEAGYDIDSVDPDPRSNELFSFQLPIERVQLSHNSDTSAWSIAGSVPRIVNWNQNLQQASLKRKRHIENCELCRTQHSPLSTEERKEYVEIDDCSSGVEETRGVQEQVEEKDVRIKIQNEDQHEHLVIARPQSIPALFQAELSISGMTCSSCVNSVTSALQHLPWVHNVTVNLISHSASVSFNADHHADEIVSVIEDIGFDATVQQITDIAAASVSKLTEDSWKATYSIGGMTCSSCSNAISTALRDFRCVKSAEVNLMGNSATIVLDGKKNVVKLQDAIEEIGYEAKLEDLVSLASEVKKRDTLREVAIQVDGMYCEHCPSKIERALAGFGSASTIEIEKLPTPSRPILNIRYLPQPPKVTIRQIFKVLSEADPAFEPIVFHPPSIEERSRMMQQREQRHILDRAALTILAAIPTFVIGIVYMDLVPSMQSGRQYLMQKLHGVERAQWALFIMATPVYFCAADLFHRRTLKELRALWRPGSPVPLIRRFIRFGSMNMLVSLGTTIAYISSVAILITAATHAGVDINESNDFYFDSVVFLTMFLLIGRFMEAYSKAKAGDAVASIGQLRPKEALLIEQGIDARTSDPAPRPVSVDLLELGDIIKIQNGSSPACDGIVIEGSTKFDESSLTGESRPITKSIGDDLFVGTINQGGAVSMRVTSVAGASMLDQIMKVVREGQTRRAPVERVADLITGHFVPGVTFIAVFTWIIWLILGLAGTLPDDYLDTNVGGWPYWSLRFAIAVFVVACPCGIGLAAPTALFVGGGWAAKHGILVKGGGEAFQEASQLDCIVFDKTGTLTLGGEPKVTDHELFTDMESQQFLSMIKRLEEDSSHPIAKAIVAFCTAQGNADVDLVDTSEIPGKGMLGNFNVTANATTGVGLLIGNEALMRDQDVLISESVALTLKQWKMAAKSVVLIATRPTTTDTFTLAAILSVSDPLRPEAAPVIRALQKRGVAVWMLSGDNADTARAVGRQLRISADNIIAGVLPEHKADKIKYLQRSLPSRRRQHGSQTGPRAIVAMVGDGINDSPALATADVGIAIGSGSDVAISTASFVLLTSNLTALLTLLDLSRAVFRRIKFNFGWALLYNVIGVPVAAGVLYPLKSGGSHVRLDPVWAALAMALSSVSVVTSSLLLRTRLPLVGFRAPEVEQDFADTEEEKGS